MENNKAVEAVPNSAGGVTTGQTANGNAGANPDLSTMPNPKLGMAPLSSELVVAAASNNVTGESHQPSNPPRPDPPQSTDPQNAPTSIPTVDPPRSDPAATGPTQVPGIPVFHEPAPQVDDPPPNHPDSTNRPPDPTSTIVLAEQAPPPNPNPTPSDPPPTDLPTDAGSHSSHIDNAPEEKG